MMNQTRKELIDYLNANPDNFDMARWGPSSCGPSSCGTIGCIAGTAVWLESCKLGVYNIPNAYAVTAAELLDLPLPVARHLFLPGTWVRHLKYGGFEEHYEPIWKGNYRCDLTTIERMKDWASELPGGLYIYRLIKAPQAIRALETLEDHPHYVDWAEAIEPA